MLIKLSTWSCLEIRITGRSNNINNDDSSFEMVQQFKYLSRKLTNQTSVQEEIKSRLKSGNACYYSM
jgi:hypothetical protein